MKNSMMPMLMIAVFIGVVVVSNAAFIVPETKSAIVLRFGEATARYPDAGLKFKTPFVEDVKYFDKRNLELDQPELEIIASNQERLIVDAFARYKITDPLLFYQTAGDEAGGVRQLTTLMNQTVRRVLGEVSVDDIVSTQRSSLMIRIRDLLGESAKRFGIEIVDVKIRRADLPAQNSQAVFQRMITERKQIAQQTRAEGGEASQQIKAEADRRATEIRAEAEEESQKLRGAADGERNAVFADAYNKDPEFFAFYRSLTAYEDALQKGDTTILLSPDSEFLWYFHDLQGNRR